MPPKETKEQKEKRLKTKRRTLSQRSRERRYNVRLYDTFSTSQRSLGSESFKLSKQIITENAEAFRAKYADPDSALQKRLAYKRQAYLQNTLSKDDYENSPEFKLAVIVDEVMKNGISEYSQYASIDDMYTTHNVGGQNVKRFTYAGKRAEETDHLKKASESFTKAEKQVDELINTEYGDSEAFQEFYSDLKDLTDETKRIVSGGLSVPDSDDRYTVHVKLTKEVEETDPLTGSKVTKTVIREPELHAVTQKAQAQHHGQVTYNIQYRSVADEPLFSHEPCPEDIQQGAIGDCYFIATMSSIADNNPDFIRNCMKDNGDGTVTVRLYDDQELQDIYTTVNKTVPMVDRGQNGKEEWVPAYGKGALWVSMLEKAFVQSGIVHSASMAFADNNTVGYEFVGDQRKPFDRNNYEEIIGGRTEDATVHILGEYISQAKKKDMEIKLPQGGSDPDPYTEEETAFFEKVAKAYQNGDAITAGIAAQSSNDTDDMYKESNGLPRGHAYTVIGTEKDPQSGKWFIKVRNPHMKGGRTYDKNWKSRYEPRPEVPGESKVELRDFVKTFRDCYAATYKASYFETKNAGLAADDRTMYSDAVEQACNEIIGTDHAFVWTNSKQFKDLKKAAIALKAEFKKDLPDHRKMDEKLKTFFQAARNYRENRDARNQTLDKDSRSRSMDRYRLADAVGHFEEIYNANQQKGAELQYVDFDKCKELALDLDMKKGYDGLSQAKNAAIKGLVKDPDGSVSSDESAAQRIDDVERSGLRKIEDGLRNYSTNDLMQGLCEVLASRSVRAHQADIRPQDIERSLSPESIERVRDHFGKKLESALRSIDKNEFLTIMNAGNIGETMAEKVNQHLNQNEAQPQAPQNTAKNGGPGLSSNK